MPEEGKDASHGDSSGPMAINGQLAVIVYWGHGFAVKDHPGISTEDPYY